MFKNIFKPNSFMRNFSILTIGEVFSRGIGMLTNVILARALAPELYGKYALFLTYLAILQTIASFGLQPIIIRTIARNQDNSKKVFYLSLILRLFGYFVSISAFMVFSIFNTLDLSTFILLALLAAVFLNSFWDAFQNVAFGMERMEWTSIINVISAGLLLLVYLIVPKNIISIEFVIGAFVIVFFLKDLAYIFSLYKSKLVTGNYKLSFNDSSDIKSLFKDSMPYYILALFTLLSSQLPILFLEINSGSQEVAYFNTANKLLLPLSLLIMTGLNVIFPNQSKLFITNKDEFIEKIQRILILIVIVGTFGATIVSLFRNELVYLLYGTEYKSTGDVLAYQAWYIVLYAIFCFIGGTYGAANKQKLVATTSIVYGILSVPILWYASIYGANGLAKGYIVASVINMTYCYYYLMKIIDFKIKKSFTLKLFSSFVLSFISVILIPTQINIFYRISIVLVIILILILKRKWFQKILK